MVMPVYTMTVHGNLVDQVEERTPMDFRFMIPFT